VANKKREYCLGTGRFSVVFSFLSWGQCQVTDTQLSTEVDAPLPEIVCISRPDLDINMLTAAGTLCEITIARLTDRSSIPLSEPAKLLVYLAELFSPESNSAIDVLRNVPTGPLKHLCYTFLAVTDKLTACDFRVGGRLNVDSRDCANSELVVSLGTGPLLEWIEFILANSTTRQSFHFRILLNKLQLFLEREEKLSLLFDDYSKIRMEDQSFILERK
jgi:hypothetical protein